MTDLLDPQQIARYGELRGYSFPGVTTPIQPLI
jgi:hypothetical protein